MYMDILTLTLTLTNSFIFAKKELATFDKGTCRKKFARKLFCFGDKKGGQKNSVNISYIFILGAIYLGKVIIASPKISLNLSKPMRNHIVKENHIGSTFSEIIWYRQTEIILLQYKLIIRVSIPPPFHRC